MNATLHIAYLQPQPEPEAESEGALTGDTIGATSQNNLPLFYLIKFLSPCKDALPLGCGLQENRPLKRYVNIDLLLKLFLIMSLRLKHDVLCTFCYYLSLREMETPV
jgi:hypothetical protein